MRHFITTLLFCFLVNTIQSQAIYEEFQSDKLQESRKLKIQLPRNFNPDLKAGYPLIIVLDGDYLFEPITGNIDYQSYWEDIPDCVVVGIKQSETRESDLYYDEDTFFPAHEGAQFFEFIGMELIQYMENNYNTSNFRMIAGHDLSANFINYFLFKDEPLFRAFISLSPDLAPEMTSRLQQKLPILQQETFYYLATSDADLKRLKADIEDLNSKLSTITNEKLHYKFDNFEDANHYSLVGRGIPKALNEIFALYKPINGKEYKEKLLAFEGTPYEYLIKKYDAIEYFYGFKKEVIENDIRAIAAASNKKNDLESLEELSKLAKKTYPDSMISAYYLGMHHEKEGNLKRALQRYQSGLLLEPSQFIDKDVLLDKIYEIKDEMKH